MRRLLAKIAAVSTFGASAALAITVDTNNYRRCAAGVDYACRDLFIESFDGVPLDATLYVPTAAGPASPQPAILMTHGYGGWHRGAGDMSFQKLLAGQGYVVLAWTSRGFGRSGGSVQLQSPDWEVRDARHLVGWLADSDNTGDSVMLDAPGDPRIGMVGGSYAGGIQLLTASYDQRLDAITPQITWNDLCYSLAPNGVVKHGWIDLLYTSGKFSGYFGPLGTPPPLPVVGTDGVPTDQDVQVLSTFLTNDNVEMPIPFSDGSRSSYEYLKRRSPVWEADVFGAFRPVIDNIHAATLLIQGQQDTLFRVNEAMANRDAIADNGLFFPIPTKLVVFSGGHGYGDMGCQPDPTVPTCERKQINDRIFAWFDRYLRGNSTSTGPALELWQPWVAGTNFLGLSDLPAATTPVVPLSATVATLVNAVAPTSHSEATNFQPTTSSPSVDAASGATAADLAGPITGSNVDIAGVPVLTFTISAPAPEAIVFAKLYDEDTMSGARTLIHHMVTPARIRAGQGDFCSEELPGVLSASPVDGVDVCLPLAAIVWRVAPGHRLVLTVATSDTMHFSSRFPAVYQISDVALSIPTLP